MGYSYEKRPIQLVSLSLNSSENNETVDKKAIFIECGINSSEWIYPAFCLYAISKLVQTQNSNGPLNHFDFHIMPILNPDGLQYSWKHLRMWRKNRRPHNCNEMDPIKSYPEHAKGQLISKCPFGVFKPVKKAVISSKISALFTEKSSNQKKGTLLFLIRYSKII